MRLGVRLSSALRPAALSSGFQQGLATHATAAAAVHWANNSSSRVASASALFGVRGGGGVALGGSSCGGVMIPSHQCFATEAAAAVAGGSEEEVVPEEEVVEEGKTGFILKAKELHVGPKKLNYIAKQLAGLNLTEAYAQMGLSDKRIAKTRVKQLIKSAWYVAEAHHQLDPLELVIKEAWIGKDTYLKRRMYHSKGRMGIKTRYRTTLTIRLEKEEPKMVGLPYRQWEKHGKYSGLMRQHWKKWKGWHAQPKPTCGPDAVEGGASSAVAGSA